MRLDHFRNVMLRAILAFIFVFGYGTVLDHAASDAHAFIGDRIRPFAAPWDIQCLRPVTKMVTVGGLTLAQRPCAGFPVMPNGYHRTATDAFLDTLGHGMSHACNWFGYGLILSSEGTLLNRRVWSLKK